MASNNADGRFGSIAEQQGIVIQTRFDSKDLHNRTRVDTTTAYVFPGAKATTNNAVIRTDINDLVFRVNTSRGKGHSVLDNAIEVTSYCNGLFLPHARIELKDNRMDPNDEERKERYILRVLSESIRFMGVALGASNPNPDSEEHVKLQFTTRVHGTSHILNTGNETLAPGDVLLWDLFTTKEIMDDAYKQRLRRFGFAEEKVPLKTITLGAAHLKVEGTLADEMKQREVDLKGDKRLQTALGAYVNGIVDFAIDCCYFGDIADPSIQNASRDDYYDPSKDKGGKVVKMLQDEGFLKSAMEFVGKNRYFIMDIERRKIGKVLSFAKPGKGVDILLGSC